MNNLIVDEINDMEGDVIDDWQLDVGKCKGRGPLGEGNIEPYVGLEFVNQNQAYEFYNTYGYILGFSIRVNTSYKNVKGVVTSIRLVCSKHGFAKGKKSQLEETLEMVGDANEKTPEKQTSIKRCGCKASCTVRLHDDGKWRVTAFHKVHNHAYVQNTPSKKRHLRSHKQISMEERTNIELLNEQNVGATQIKEYLAAKAGGRGNLHFSKKDVSNQIGKAKKKLVGVDVNAMIDYFMRRQQSDPDFFFEVEPDEDDVVRNIFWVDGRSRRAYQEFGDVVVFNTTYQTNKYCMPMGPFVGVNHHRQSIFFGCALIRDEKKGTFEWLFTKWLHVMGGRKPKCIFTDQCPSMRAAIEKVFGVDTVHRCCLWHVMKNAKDHLLVIYGAVDGFSNEFSDLITYSWTVADFEANWSVFIKKYKMESNPHLNMMFDKRDKWAPAYFRETFCAGMSTTQRSESMNAVTKIWMASNTSLYDFATRFEKMVEGIYEKESDEDIRTSNEVAQLWSCDPIEAEARKVYTRKVFSLFKAKLRKCTALRIREVEKDRLYEVHPARANARYEWYKPNRMVSIDKTNSKVDCDCTNFQFEGLLCSHALEVMRLTSMEPFLPTHYILKRWSRDANKSTKKGTNQITTEGANLHSVMLNALNQRWEKLSKEALKHRGTYEMICIELDGLVNVAIENNDKISQDMPTLDCKGQAVSESQHSLNFHDPPVSQCKGKRKPQRFKHPGELKSAKKLKTCRYCHKKEGHNMRNCPKRMKDVANAKGNEVDCSKAIEDKYANVSQDLALD